MGLVTTSSGVQLHQVRVQRNFPAGQDPGGVLAALCITDYFLDPQSSLVTEVIDQTHAVGNPAASFAHEIDLGNYAVVNGVSVPMTVSESVDGQMIWQVQLSSISFNVGLTTACSGWDGISSSWNDGTHPAGLAALITYSPAGPLASVYNGCVSGRCQYQFGELYD